jgi:hypothetical protein
MKKLDQLNDLNCDDTDEVIEARCVVGEIAGQLRGRPALKDQFADIMKKLNSLSEGRIELTNPRKRALVSELREKLKCADLVNYKQLAGE